MGLQLLSTAHHVFMQTAAGNHM